MLIPAVPHWPERQLDTVTRPWSSLLVSPSGPARPKCGVKHPRVPLEIDRILEVNALRLQAHVWVFRFPCRAQAVQLCCDPLDFLQGEIGTGKTSPPAWQLTIGICLTPTRQQGRGQCVGFQADGVSAAYTYISICF